MEFTYPATFTRDEDGRVMVAFPDFPSYATDGKDSAEAMQEAVDCLGSAIAHAIAEGEDIPAPSVPVSGQESVPVPLWIGPKLALHFRMKQMGINNSELARRLGVKETVVRRMLDPDHASRPEKIQAALRELGQILVMSAS
jgi:antitoxin HicB